MRIYRRRTLLSALGFALPTGLGLGVRAKASVTPSEAAPTLAFLPFEEALRAAFAIAQESHSDASGRFVPVVPCRRVEIGASDEVRTGLQGCVNDRLFAGFPAGHLRIIATGSAPGPVRQGVRLYVTTVDIALTRGSTRVMPGRPLDFASLPPAPIFS